MILVNTPDGITTSINVLDTPTSILLSDVTGISILKDGINIALPLPKKFTTKPKIYISSLKKDEVIIGEVVDVRVDGILISLTNTFDSKHVRLNIVRQGVMRYAP